jgi:hypothetical protein
MTCSQSPVVNRNLVFLLAVVEGFLSPTCQIVAQVISFLDVQRVNDAGVLFLGFLDATTFDSSAEHKDDIQAVLRHRHGCKNGADFEENSGLGRSHYDLTAMLDQFNEAVVQLDDFWRLAFQLLLDAERAAGMSLIAVLELTTTTRAAPEGRGSRGLRLPSPHFVGLSGYRFVDRPCGD